jgi:hypothetical protein
VASITLVQSGGGWHTTARLGGGYGGYHPPKGGGVWVAVVKSATNGFYNW